MVPLFNVRSWNILLYDYITCVKIQILSNWLSASNLVAGNISWKCWWQVGQYAVSSWKYGKYANVIRKYGKYAKAASWPVLCQSSFIVDRADCAHCRWKEALNWRVKQCFTAGKCHKLSSGKVLNVNSVGKLASIPSLNHIFAVVKSSENY